MTFIDIFNIVYEAVVSMLIVVKPQQYILLIGMHVIVALTLIRRKIKDPLEFFSWFDLLGVVRLFIFNTSVYVGATFLSFVGAGNSFLEYMQYLIQLLIVLYCVYNVYANTIYISINEGFKFFLVELLKSVKSRDLERLAEWYTNSRRKAYLVKQNIIVMNGMNKVMRRACRYVDRAIEEKHTSSLRAAEIKAICKDVDLIRKKIDLQSMTNVFDYIVEHEFKDLEENLNDKDEMISLGPALQETKLKLLIVAYQQGIVKEFINTNLTRWIAENEERASQLNDGNES